MKLRRFIQNLHEAEPQIKSVQNPDRAQFDAMMERGQGVRGWLLGKNAVMWAAYDGTHFMFAEQLPEVMPNGIPVFAEPDGSVRITGSIHSTKWEKQARSDPRKIEQLVQRHPIWRRLGLKPSFRMDEAKRTAMAPRDVMSNPNFRAWFGQSKVVDRQGQPLIVYHGTFNDFHTFSADEAPYRGGILAFFGTKPKIANAYSGPSAPDASGGNVMPCYLRVENPFDYRTDWSVAGDFYDQTGGISDNDDANRILGGLNHKSVKDDDNYMQNGPGARGLTAALFMRAVQRGHWPALEASDFVEWLRNEGYDGIVMRELTSLNYAIFEPGQVKSAVGNSGEYDEFSDVIHESIEQIGKATVHSDPSWAQTVGLVRSSAYRALRGLVVEGHVYVWDAYDAWHQSVYEELTGDSAGSGNVAFIVAEPDTGDAEMQNWLKEGPVWQIGDILLGLNSGVLSNPLIQSWLRKAVVVRKTDPTPKPGPSVWDTMLSAQPIHEKFGPMGECFTWALKQFWMRKPAELGLMLVHAEVNPWDHSYPHAWLEDSQHVWDWQTTVQKMSKYGVQGCWPKSEFYETFHPKNVRKWSELRTANARHKQEKHAGPWAQPMMAESIDSDNNLAWAAIQHFGLTNDYRECGYIIPFRSWAFMLDLSGKHEHPDYERQPREHKYVQGMATNELKPGKRFDDLRGSRYTDHRSLGEFLPGLGSGTDEMIEFMQRTGAIRVDPGVGIHLVRVPPLRQMLMKAFGGHFGITRDPIQVDLTLPNGQEVTREFTYRNASSTVQKWVQQQFAGGTAMTEAFVDRIDLGHRQITVYGDPTDRELTGLVQKFGPLRGVADPAHIWVWNGNDGIHLNVAEELGLTTGEGQGDFDSLMFAADGNLRTDWANHHTEIMPGLFVYWCAEDNPDPANNRVYEWLNSAVAMQGHQQ